jgi:monofunctional biosynthetic peptidoglycan transglycosylase
MTDQGPPDHEGADPQAQAPAGPDEPAAAAAAPDPPPSPPGPPIVPPPPTPRARRRRSWWVRLIVWVLVLALVLPPAWVAVYRFAPPPITPLMIIRMSEGKGLDYRWRPLSQISPALVQAAVAAEDQRFCQHNGFDVQAIQKAMAHNQRRPGRVRGGSTISQQTAKNVFLWPSRSYLRKGLEAYFTVLIEAIWGKRRIMEVYLNVVEMGPGLYGAQAAGQRYFGADAAQLTNLEASRLAAIFPNPLKWKAVNPGRYVQGRSRKIGGAMGAVRDIGLSACVGKLSGVVPASPPELGAPPPKAAEAFVRQQQAEQAAEEAPAASSLPPSDEALPPSGEPEGPGLSSATVIAPPSSDSLPSGPQ